MNYSTSTQNYRADIDGLRSIAVVSVFLYHLQPQLLPGGFLGVDVFFIISGYLITNIIVRENLYGVFSFRRFYARRVKRIFPALFVVIALFTPLAILSLAPETYINYMKAGRYSAAQLANFLFARKVGYFNEGFQGQPLLHTWSLGVEEQFYLFWPLLLFFCFFFFKKQTTIHRFNDEERAIKTGVGAVLLFVACLSFLVCFWLAESDHRLAFYMFYTRAWEFCIGGIVSLGILPRASSKRNGQILGLVGMLLLFWGLFFVEDDYLGMSFLQCGILFPCLGSALLIYSQQEASFANSVLARPLPVFIGKISYSLYLYHWPVIVFWKIFQDSQEISFQAAVGISVLVFILAVLSYYYIEQPARKSRFSDFVVLVTGGIVIVLFALTFKVLEGCDEAAWRIQKDGGDFIEKRTLYPENVSIKEKDGVIYHEFGNNNEKTPLLGLVGDSHAPHFFRAAVAWAGKNGYGVRFLAKPGCPMLFGDVHIRSYIDKEQERLCDSALPLFVSEIIEDPRVSAVLIAQRFDLFYDGKGYLRNKNKRTITFKDAQGNNVADHVTYYQRQLSATVEELKKRGKKAILVQQVPIFDKSKDCDWQPKINALFPRKRSCSYDPAFIRKWQQPSRRFVEEFSNKNGVDVIDVFPYFRTPLVHKKNMYKNADHLNVLGGIYLTPFFVDQLDRIMQENRANNSE